VQVTVDSKTWCALARAQEYLFSAGPYAEAPVEIGPLRERYWSNEEPQKSFFQGTGDVHLRNTNARMA